MMWKGWAMPNRSDEYRAKILDKVDRLLSEFAEGKVSREQFHAIYEHYSNQLQMVDQLDSPEVTGHTADETGTTIAIRAAHMGKALGLMIYHNKRGTFVDTLGEFDIPPSTLSPTLNNFTSMMESKQLIDRRIIKQPDNRWLMFAAGRYTTVVSLFHHEPSAIQIREVERMHHDFELANESALKGSSVIDNNALAYPFVVMLQKKLKKA
jgi:hypothetical protein